MTDTMNSIMIGMRSFPFFAVLFTLPIFLIPMIKDKKINFVKVGMQYGEILYILCLTALVFFPLPTLAQAATLSTHDYQIVPFHFVVDIIKESPLRLNQPLTYVKAIGNRAVLQVIFNIIMTVPFGMFLTYHYGMDKKKVIFLSALLSLFIEITQLTGIYGIYNGSYRLCDVDDLMANTLGGYVGYCMIQKVSGILPQLDAFDIAIARRAQRTTM